MVFITQLGQLASLASSLVLFPPEMSLFSPISSSRLLCIVVKNLNLPFGDGTPGHLFNKRAKREVNRA